MTWCNMKKIEPQIVDHPNTQKYFGKLMHGLCSSIFLFLSLQNSYALDCSRANNYSEISICGDDYLLNLDDAMNKNYSCMINANIGDGARNDLKITQRKWISEKNQCLDKTCIVNSYKMRLNDVCSYPVIDGIHPVCTDFDSVSSVDSNFKTTLVNLALTKLESVKLLCDFKSQTPNFYTINASGAKKITDSGIERLTPIYNKFVGSNIILINHDYYLYGYFISIHDTTEEIAPDPFGKSYVRRSEVVCVNVNKLF